MILSVSIIQKDGGPLVARQYRPIERSKINGYLTKFSKTITSESRSYIDAGEIRYVFKVIGNFYFVMITSIDSNILDDLELLDDLVASCQSIVGTNLDKEDAADIIKENSFDLIFAFDEFIFDGYRQNVSVSDVNEFLLMKSEAEEKYLQEIREKQQIAQAAAAAKISQIKASAKDSSSSYHSSTTAYGSVSSDSVSNTGSFSIYPGSIVNQMDSYSSSSNNVSNSHTSQSSQITKGPSKVRTGMKLSSKSKSRVVDEIMASENLQKSKPTADEEFPSVSETKYNSDIVLIAKETIKPSKTPGDITLEGTLVGIGPMDNEYEISTKKNTSRQFTFRPLGGSGPDFASSGNLQFSGCGPNEEVPLLRWRHNYTAAEEDKPLSIDCFATVTKKGRESTTVFAITAIPTISMTNLTLKIPVPASETEISLDEAGSAKGNVQFFSEEEQVIWKIGKVQANENLEMEFKVRKKIDEDEFHPIRVEFQSETTFSELSVKDVKKTDGSNASFTYISSISAFYDITE